MPQRSPTRPAALAAVAACLFASGCAREKLETPDAAPPASVFQGPRELRGTIGSYARLQGGDPLLVSGYGLVVNLDRTGSAVVPEYLRGWLSNEMRKRGVGSRQLSAQSPELAAVTPERLMLSEQTAVVRVSGLIPPGASPGAPFDLLLEALPEDTDTTSLAGGQLWRTGLGVNGANRRLAFTTPLAAGGGPVYLGPGPDADADAAEPAAEPDAGGTPAAALPAPALSPAGATARAGAGGGRLAVVIGGGRATEPRRLELVLHQPSWVNARRIADTINERYRAGRSRRVGATPPTANAVSDAVIQLNVPDRFAGRPAELLALIENTYPYPVDREETVDAMMALLAAPGGPGGPGREPGADLTRRVPLVCRALGPNAVPALQRHYGSPDPRVRLAALGSGAWLADPDAVPGLAELTRDPDPAVRAAAGEALALLPDHMHAVEALAALLDDADRAVRVAAYEAAAASGSRLVDRLAVEDLDGVKFLIDRVPSGRPMVLAVPRDTPRLVLFGPQTGFAPPVFDADPAGVLFIRTPTGFAQALAGLRAGDTAFLPAVGRTEAREGPSGPVAEALDASGAAVSLRLGEAAEAFEQALPLTRGDRPFTLRCRVIDPERETLELLGVEPGLGTMPLSVFHRNAEGGAHTERVQPTVAALAWFLAHRPTMDSPQEGLDLSFSRTVGVLDRLSRSGALPAPMALLENPLVAEIAEVEGAAPTPRRDAPAAAAARADR